MQKNSESYVYVGGDDEVYGVQELSDTSQFNEYSCYGGPQLPTFSGGYFFDNQEHSYDYGAYHYENYPVYYPYPTYPGYYSLTNPQYSPENFYSAYYVYVPVNIYYYVPHFVYYLPTSTNNVNDIIYNVDSTQSYVSDMMTSSIEQSFDNSQEFNSNFYDIGNSSKEIVGEEQTTFQLLYEEYPEMLNDAPDDDEEKSESPNKKLENDVVSNGAQVNECIAVGDQSYNIETNFCEDDVDLKLIKKISSLSIDDVKEDIDVNYENAKAFVYNEVLKGYTEIKNQLEELEWECHSLEDILEEEEPESDSGEMDFNENIADDLENITLLPDEDEESHFASVSFSEESQVDSDEKDLVENNQIMMEETQPSADPLDIEEKDETDPLCLIKENLHSGSLDSIEEHHLPVDSSAIQGKDETGPFLEQSLSKEELHSGPENSIEEHNPPVASLAIQGKDKTGPFLEQSLSKEGLPSGPENSIGEHNPPVASSAIQGKDKTGPFLEQSLSKEELPSGPVKSIVEHHSPEDSYVEEENYKMDTVPKLSLRGDSVSRSSLEELHTNMSSRDRGQEVLHFTPDMLAPAASIAIPRKKRFSGLRKFFARMCCCVKKTS